MSAEITVKLRVDNTGAVQAVQQVTDAIQRETKATTAQTTAATASATATQQVVAATTAQTTAATAAAAATRQVTQTTATQSAALAAASNAITGAATRQAAAHTAVTQAMGQAAISAGQLSQANQQLPAQFTDIFTSLAGGQSPLLVAIQQGGQIRDAYGSAGLALKQMGTLALSMVNPVTVAGAAVAGLGVAAYQGAQEQSALARALVLTGGQAGVSADRLQDTAARVSSAVGTQGKAVEVLSGLIAAGVGRGAVDLAALTGAAINLERAGGPAVEETSKLFADLAGDPLAALRKLSDATGQVGPAAYAQVAALVKLGETAKAGGIAQAEAARIAQEQAGQLLPELGLLERAWLGIKDAASGAWSAAKNVGRSDTVQQQIESLQNQIKPNTPAWVAAHLQVKIDALQTVKEKTDAAAKADAVLADQARKNISAQKDWQALTESNLSAQQRFNEERARIERIGADKGASAAEIAAQISFARRRILGSQEDQFAQQQADFQGALQKRLDDDRLASIKQRVAVGALTEAEGIRQTAAVEVAAANDRAARLNALARQEQDPAKRAKAYQDAALATQDALLREAAAKREVIALSEQAAAAYRKELDSQIAAAITSQVSLQHGTEALQAQTGQVREHGIVIESVSTLVARQTAARQDAATAVQISLLQDRLALATAEEERRSIQQTIDKLQTLTAERSKAVTASASKDLAQAGYDQAKRLGAGDDQGAGLAGLKDALSGVTDGANAGLVKMVDSLSTINTLAREYSREMAVITALQSSADPADQVTAQANLAALTEKQGKAQVAAYAQMAAGALSYFDKSASGYRLLKGAETALRTYQLITSAQAAAADLAALGRRVTTWLTAESAITGASLAGSTARAGGSLLESAAAGVTAVVKAMASLPFPLNLAAGAATAAAIASLGISLGVGGGGSAVDASTTDILARRNDGTGSVLGDGSAQSKSIGNSLESIEKLGKVQVGYAGKMVSLLGSIDTALGGVTAQLITSGADVTGATIRPTSSDSYNFKLPIIGGAIGNAISDLFGSSSSSSSVVDAGLIFADQTVNQAAEWLSAAAYQTVRTEWSKSGFLGFGGSSGSSENTDKQELDLKVKGSYTRIVGQLLEVAKIAGRQLGADESTIAKLGSQKTNLGSLKLLGKTSEEQTALISAAFSKLGDQLADSLAPSLKDLAKVGEGALQSIVRLGTGLQYVTDISSKLGSVWRFGGAVGARFADDLIQRFGTLDDYISITDEYFKDFYSDAEQTAAKLTSLNKSFNDLGLSLPKTKDAYRSLVSAQNLQTQAGRNAYSELIKLAPVFNDVAASATEISGKLSSAAGKLRDSIYDVRFAGLDSQSQFSTLRDQFTSTYSLALSTTGTTLVGYADKLNQLIDPLLQKARDIGLDQVEYTSLVNSVLSRASTVADRLDVTTPNSLDLLSQINEAVIKSGGQIVEAINGVSTSTNSHSPNSPNLIDSFRPYFGPGLFSAFADGGQFSGGLRLVGERGPELEVTGPARYYSNSQTRSLLQPTSANEALLYEFQNLINEVRQLRAESFAASEAIARNTNTTARQLQRWDAGIGVYVVSTTV